MKWRTPYAAFSSSPKRILAIVSILFLAGVVAAAQEQPSAHTIPPLALTWSKAYPNLTVPPSQLLMVSVAVADEGRCFAIAGGGEAEVLDKAGKSLWKWNYRAVSRLIVPGALALSPGCDAIALAGDSGYKYVWLAERQGRALPLPLNLSSTPLGVAFAHNGERIAIGTGSGLIALVTKGGKVLWKRTVGVVLPEQMSFSADDQYVLIREGGAGVLRIDGSLLWSEGAFGMNASKDLRTFVSWSEPPHGPGAGNVTVLDGAGKEIWSRLSQDPGAVVVPAGDEVLARIAINQNPDEEALKEPLATRLQVLSREGAVVRDLPDLDGRPMAISPEGDRALIRTNAGYEVISLEGQRLAMLSVDPDAYDMSTLVVPSDFSGILIFRSRTNPELRWYALK
jgi:hypothetical protein